MIRTASASVRHAERFVLTIDTAGASSSSSFVGGVPRRGAAAVAVDFTFRAERFGTRAALDADGFTVFLREGEAGVAAFAEELPPW